MSLKLQASQSQNLKQMQRLIMSPQMQQAISLLQMPILELADRLEMEIEQNPILENDDPYSEENSEEDLNEQELPVETDFCPEKELSFEERDFEILKKLDEEFTNFFDETDNFYMARTVEEEKLKNYMESSLRAEISLFEHLMIQAEETFETHDELAMAEALIGNFDSSGFLHGPMEEIEILNHFDKNKLSEVLHKIQQFDPPGVGATNLRESLLLQLKRMRKHHSLAYQLIEENYEDLLHNRIPQIQKKMQATVLEISHAIEHDISSLDFHPGASFSKSCAQPIAPEATITLENEKLVVALDNEVIPALRCNRRYMQMLEDESLPRETKEFIKQNILSARWFCRNLQQRSLTIERIVQALAKLQYSFFSQPKGQLQPLTMKNLAEELSLHESTIARAVANKYINTPRGLLPLRFFFTNSFSIDTGEDISSATVRNQLLELIEQENKNKPLSDESISLMLKAKGVDCARRTVAKYRTILHIGNAHQRRKY